MRVFISHARNDKRLARVLSSELEKYGYEVRSADSIRPGSNIEDSVRAMLDECQAMIVILNPNSYQSQWVKLEVEHALTDERYKDKLLPVLVGNNFESSQQRIPWILTSLNHVSLSDESDMEGNAKKVAKELRSILRPRGSA